MMCTAAAQHSAVPHSEAHRCGPGAEGWHRNSERKGNGEDRNWLGIAHRGPTHSDTKSDFESGRVRPQH